MTAHAVLRYLTDHRTQWLGKVVGASLGLLGGFFGVLVGLLLGHLMDELARQHRGDREILAYLETPGKSAFFEPCPGLAAYCALATVIIAGSMDRNGGAPERGGAQIELVIRSAGVAFGCQDSAMPTVESFCRLAASRLRQLNPDLLAESLSSRRAEFGDAAYLGSLLIAMALGSKALATAQRVRRILDPAYRPALEESGHSGERDPWSVLGLEPNASLRLIKTTFRRLATQFHPDALRDLEEERQRSAAEAFMTIEKAYREILRRRRSGTPSAS